MSPFYTSIPSQWPAELPIGVRVASRHPLRVVDQPVAEARVYAIQS